MIHASKPLSSSQTPYPMQLPETLNTAWKERHLEKLKTYIIPTESQKWGQLILTWNEKRGGQLIPHLYAPWIDLEEWSGFYVDDGPYKIFSKCLLQCACRPFHLIAKTVHHLLMIPVFLEIYKTFKGAQSLNECLKHSFQSIADILLTPLFDSANMISSLAIVLLSPFNHELLLSGRRFLGKLERLSNWGANASRWSLTPCFQPRPFEFLDKYADKTFADDTLYPSEDLLDRQLTNFARSSIHYQQTHCDRTTCQRASINKPYMSPVDLYETVATKRPTSRISSAPGTYLANLIRSIF